MKTVENNLFFPDSPQLWLRLGQNLKQDNIKVGYLKLCMMWIWFSIQEGDDVYFDCAIEANPRVHEIVWKHNVSITPVITYISISHYHPICITTIVKVHSWVFCFQGNILGRNSAGLIMNEGNLILQQVTKDSAGSRMIAHRWWWWICFGVEMRTTFHPFGQSFGILSRCTRAGGKPHPWFK